MRRKLKLIPEPGDTPEDRIQAQSEFLRAIGFAGAGSQTGTQLPTKPSTLFSELIKDYERDRLAAKRWTPTTQKENLGIYKLCMNIIGDIPISEIGDEQALTYFGNDAKAAGQYEQDAGLHRQDHQGNHRAEPGADGYPYDQQEP